MGCQQCHLLKRQMCISIISVTKRDQQFERPKVPYMFIYRLRPYMYLYTTLFLLYEYLYSNKISLKPLSIPVGQISTPVC